ncbi:hypothetical protein C4572_01400 [Candidatus Parcubacteria bacterium]|nr:MAG: hypothetical protein C4572_01400 [Candidatus Parcubacteria bacterium]
MIKKAEENFDQFLKMIKEKMTDLTILVQEKLGKVNLVFPAYKTNKDERLHEYINFAKAMARKVLSGFDNMNEKSQLIVATYELTCAIEKILERIEKMERQEKQKEVLKKVLSPSAPSVAAV